MEKLTFLQLAEKILREEQIPLTYSEIWEIAKEKGWDKLVRTGGETPLNTLASQLSTNIKREDSLFEVIGTRPKKFIIKGMEHDTAIATLHEEIYLFLQELREKNPELYFLTRNTDAHGRLGKGYWFWGNNDFIILTFWKGSDKRNGGRYIGFEIEKDGTCTLILRATDDEKKAKIFKTIASILPNMKQLKWAGEDMAIWERRYESKDYLANIQDFINQKSTIDSILGIASEEILAELMPVNKDVFEKNIEIIASYRNKKNEPEPEEEFIIMEDDKLLLRKLSIENIGIFSHLELDFSERVTVLIGENGIGKTTILRAIALALAGVNENSLLDAHHPKIQQLFRIENESQKNAQYSTKGNIHLEYDYLGKSYQNTILFGADAYGIKVEDDPNSDFACVDNDKFPHLVIGFSQALTTETPLTVKQIPYEKLAAIKEAHIKDLLPLLYNQADKRFEAFADWVMNLYNIGNQSLIENKEQKTVKEHQLIHFTFEIISEIIGSKISFKSVKLAQGKDAQSFVWIHDAARQQDIPLHLISQGFNSVFGWVGYFMMRLYESSSYTGTDGFGDLHFGNQDNAIVLIDEIDTYLHPKWQKNVLKVLVDKFPNTQFVVTTHSPLVLATLDNKKASAYRITRDKAEKIHYFYGTRIQDLIYQEYGINERPAQEINTEINQLLDALYDDKKEVYQPLYAKLLDALGEDDPAILDAKLLIEEKEGI